MRAPSLPPPPPSLSEISVIGSVAFRKRRATTEDTSSAINKTRLPRVPLRLAISPLPKYEFLSRYRYFKALATRLDISTGRLLYSWAARSELLEFLDIFIESLPGAELLHISANHEMRDLIIHCCFAEFRLFNIYSDLNMNFPGAASGFN